MRRIIKLAALSLHLTAGELCAQATSDTGTTVTRPDIVAAGDTVRLHRGVFTSVQGILVRGDSTGLWVSSRPGAEGAHYPFTSIRSAEVARGTRRQGASSVTHGALVGMAVGVGVTAAALASEKRERGVMLVAGAVLTAASAGVGALVGSVVAFTHVPNWVGFDPVTLRINQ